MMSFLHSLATNSCSLRRKSLLKICLEPISKLEHVHRDKADFVREGLAPCLYASQ